MESTILAPTANNRRRTRHYALAVLAAALVTRLMWVAGAHITPLSDFKGYDALGWRWASEGRFCESAYRTPGYPAFLALVYSVRGHDHQAAHFVQAVITAGAAGLIVLVAGRLVSPGAAALAGVLYASSPTALAYVPVLASENLAVPLLVLGIYLLTVCHQERRPWRCVVVAAGGGVAFGLNMLVRPAVLFFVPGILLALMTGVVRFRYRVVCAGVLLLGVLTALAPWLIRNERAGLGITTLSTSGGINLWLGNNPDAVHGGHMVTDLSAVGGERARDTYYRTAALDWIRDHPGRYTSLCVTRAARLLGPLPDCWAVDYVWPSAETDELCLAAHRAAWGGPALSVDEETRLREVRRSASHLLGGVRVFFAPLMMLGFALAFVRRGDLAPVLWPATCYALGLSLTFAQLRFRELLEPLMVIPLAALLCDVLLRSTNLGQWPHLLVKRILVVVLVVVSPVVNHNGWLQPLYELQPLPKTPDTVQLESSSADAIRQACGALNQYDGHGRWRHADALSHL